jgi:hypothetical protein
MVSGMPRPYPKEFKQGAIVLARTGERPIAEVAQGVVAVVVASARMRDTQQCQPERGHRLIDVHWEPTSAQAVADAMRPLAGRG